MAKAKRGRYTDEKTEKTHQVTGTGEMIRLKPYFGSI